MIALFLIKYWKHLLIISSLGGFGFLAYHKIYDIGYREASVKYEKQIKDFNDTMDRRINTLESGSTVLIQQVLLGNQATKTDLLGIMKTLKGKPLYTIDPKGQCKLSDDFIKAYNEGIGRVNK